ncbi:MAG: dienelactone hydrolase family protein [Planctomycetaceae bacterium]|nr:dienelactone hydrolase family protein [Planctomycetaceae bacterium]
MKHLAACILGFAWAICAGTLVAADVPQSVAELWADFDPRREPLQSETIREWTADGVVIRMLRFQVGTFKGQPARMVALYGFPEGTKDKLPGVLHIHGGGQRASASEIVLLALRGYAVLSVHWGGASGGQQITTCEGAQAGDPNTDWGAVDPTQLNVPGYSSTLPGPKQFYEDREHPKNNNWYLLTLGCRRALTLLEQQPEVDPARLGVHGYSMGGNLTMYVVGTDSRVKVAVPGVGGQGWRWERHEFLGGSDIHQEVRGDVELFRKTLSFESYAPQIHCPLLHRSATNDFHGWMDDVYRTNALIPGQPVRYAWSPHFNHRLSPEVAVTMPLWLDQYLKGGPALPETPTSELQLSNPAGVPTLRVTPQATWPVMRCEIYYSVDPDPRARFWRSGDVTRKGDTFTASLPLHTLDLPLFAFANVYYRLPEPAKVRFPGLPAEIAEVCLSTMLHRATIDELRSAQVRTTLAPSRLIDDFTHGWRDWYQLNAGNRDHWQHWTRKVTDPVWRGPAEAKLAITFQLSEANHVAFVVQENEWRGYRGPRRTYVVERELPGKPEPQTITLSAQDFQATGKHPPLGDWSQLDQLGICAYHQERRTPASEPVRRWQGTPLQILRVEWK